MFAPDFALAQPALVIWLLKFTALLLAALVAASALRRSSAGARHLVWLASLVGVLALPALSLWAPVRLAILPSRLTTSLPAASDASSTSPAVPSTTEKSLTAGRSTPASSSSTTTTPASARFAPPIAPAAEKPLFPIGATLLAVWIATSVVLLGWLAYGALSVRRIVRRSRSLENTPWMTSLCDIADRLDLEAIPRLVASDRVEMPFACGILSPTIVLPVSAEEWSADRRRAVLFHELAHVRRRDLVGHTLGRLACAVYWFHPLVWTAARHLRAESERACDDLVLSCGARASDYADHLLDLVVGVRRLGAPATAMPMARRRELEGRVLAILDPGVRRAAPGRLQAAGLVALLGVLALSVAAMAPAPTLAATAREQAKPNEPLGRSDVSGRSVAARPSDGQSTNRANGSVPNSDKPQKAQKAQNGSQAAAGAQGDQALASLVTGTIANAANAVSPQVRQPAAALQEAAEVAKDGKVSPQSARVDTAQVRMLTRVLRSDPDASVRRTAAWGLSEASDMPGAIEALVEAVRDDEDANVREMAAWALAGSKREAAQRALVDALRRDESDEVRESAAWALAETGARRYQEAFEEALGDASPHVRETAAWALGNLGRRPAPRGLLAALSDREPEVRETAAWALAEIEDSETGSALVDAFLKETNSDVRKAELRAILSVGAQDRRILDAALASKDTELRARGVRMLAGAGAGVWPEPRPRPRPRPSP